MTAFAQHFLFEFRTGLRNKDRLLLNYLFPLGFYVMMGLLMVNINPMFQETMLPAMVVFTILSAAILGLPSPLVEARDGGVFRSYRINGVPSLSILAIPALTTLFHALIVSAIIALTINPLFGAPLPVDWVSFWATSLLVALACAGLGSLIGVISSNTQVTVLWSQLIYLPSMMLSGMMVPLSLLPAGLARAAALLPATHAMRAYAAYAYGQPVSGSALVSVLALTAGGVLALGLAMLLFRWDSQLAERRAHPALALLALAPYAASLLFL
jgi:ABC-2 type transport system permease protein